MNQHYHELKIYLQEIEHHPELVIEKDYVVFRSEKELYGGNIKASSAFNVPSCVCLKKNLIYCIQCWLLELLE